MQFIFKQTVAQKHLKKILSYLYCGLFSKRFKKHFFKCSKCLKIEYFIFLIICNLFEKYEYFSNDNKNVKN